MCEVEEQRETRRASLKGIVVRRGLSEVGRKKAEEKGQTGETGLPWG